MQTETLSTICPNENGDGAYCGRLHELDFGAHIHYLEEDYGTGRGFDWGDGTLVERGDLNLAAVTHPFSVDGMPAVALATYRLNGEGDMLSLSVHDHRGQRVLL